jgi:hypothetical protein
VVDSVATYIDRRNQITVDDENGPQIAFNYHRHLAA